MRLSANLLVFGLCAFGVACGGQSRINSTSTTKSTTADSDNVDDEDDEDEQEEDEDGTRTDEDGDGSRNDNDPVTEDDPTQPLTYDDPTFGDDCTSTDECGPGLVCSGLVSGSTTCTVPCVGSGKGGNDDCPSGYACWNWESTTLDGLQICLADWQLGSDTSGYPFTTAPGGYCDESSNACQTSVCNTETSTCVVQCMADRDCESDEVCYAYPLTDSTRHVCRASDSSDLAAGESCSDDDECDSGICLGQCNDGSPCGEAGDCDSGTCSGACVSHCRSVEDCDSDMACNYWPMIIEPSYSWPYSSWVPVCTSLIYSGDGDLGDGCSGDDDCSSEWCIDGFCTTPCATADDCASAIDDTECIQLHFYSGSTPVYSGGFCLEP